MKTPCSSVCQCCPWFRLISYARLVGYLLSHQPIECRRFLLSHGLFWLVNLHFWRSYRHLSGLATILSRQAVTLSWISVIASSQRCVTSAISHYSWIGCRVFSQVELASATHSDRYVHGQVSDCFCQCQMFDSSLATEAWKSSWAKCNQNFRYAHEQLLSQCAQSHNKLVVCGSLLVWIFQRGAVFRGWSCRQNDTLIL